jgi:hypothetical protein
VPAEASSPGLLFNRTPCADPCIRRPALSIRARRIFLNLALRMGGVPDNLAAGMSCQSVRLSPRVPPTLARALTCSSLRCSGRKPQHEIIELLGLWRLMQSQVAPIRLCMSPTWTEELFLRSL